MKDIRIVFMGTPDFAVTILKQLVANKYTIAGVITAVDKPAGRGRKLNQSAVKKYALSQNLPVLQPRNLKKLLVPNYLKKEKKIHIFLAKKKKKKNFFFLGIFFFFFAI